MRNLSLFDRCRQVYFGKKRFSFTNRGLRRPMLEMLEARNMLTASGFPGNDCPPDLDLSAVVNQAVTAGQLLTVNLLTAGGTIEDLNTAGNPTGDTIRYYLDPDIGTDTPVGASLTVGGVFTWTPTVAQIGTHKIVVIAVDSGTPALADAETFTVVVSAAMPAAVVDLNGDGAGTGFNATFVESGAAVAIVDTDLSVTDADNTNLESATVTLTNRPDGADEVLAVTTTGTPIVANYTPGTGVLSLTGTATVAQYQQVLRTLTYDNDSPEPDASVRTVQVVVNDGTSNSTPAVATVTIQAVNDAPSVDLNGADAGTGFVVATYTEGDTPVAIVSANATIGDVDSTNLNSATITITNLLDGNAELLEVVTTGTSITAVYTPATGVLALTGSDSLTNYQQVLRSLKYSNSSQNPTSTARSISVVVNDGTSNSTARTSTISAIVGVNDPPALAAIAAQSATVGVPFQVIVTATDPENDTLTYQLDRDDPMESIPASAIITKNNNNEAVITWTPSVADGPGPFTFVVLVTDDDATALSDREQFVVTLVTAAPIVDLNGGDAGTGFASNFTEGDAAVLIVDTDLAVSDSDSSTLSSATVTITNLQNGTDESLEAVTTGTAITANYVAATGVLTLSSSDSLANYQQVLRTLRYNNTSQDPGELARSITVVVNDGTNNSTTATATVSVTGVNDAINLVLPAPYDDEATPIEVTLGNAISFTATATDLDHAPGEITFFLDLDGSGILPTSAQPTITTPPTAVPGGLFQWTPNALGTFTITILVTDGQGLPDQETFTITVVAPPSGLAAAFVDEESALDAAFASLD